MLGQQLKKTREEAQKHEVEIKQDGGIGRAREHEWDVRSHYDPKANRCYVELSFMSGSTNPSLIDTQLYDGQTLELIAFAKEENGEYSGCGQGEVAMTLKVTKVPHLTSVE